MFLRLLHFRFLYKVLGDYSSFNFQQKSPYLMDFQSHLKIVSKVLETGRQHILYQKTLLVYKTRHLGKKSTIATNTVDISYQKLK